jgi:hypothetical protein
MLALIESTISDLDTATCDASEVNLDLEGELESALVSIRPLVEYDDDVLVREEFADSEQDQEPLGPRPSAFAALIDDLGPPPHGR